MITKKAQKDEREYGEAVNSRSARSRSNIKSMQDKGLELWIRQRTEGKYSSRSLGN